MAKSAAKDTRLTEWGRKGRKKKRKKVRPSLQEELRKRSGGRCEDCGRPLESEQVVKRGGIWRDTVSFPVYENYPCHRCGFRFPVVDAGRFEDDTIGARIQEQFPAFYKDYSRTERERYWMNHCPECGAKQGAFYVGVENTFDVEPDREITFPSAPKWEPEEVDHYVRERWGNVHHVDGNPANNTGSNLVLLCVRCHKVRHDLGARKGA